jgi:uncharacterized protein
MIISSEWLKEKVLIEHYKFEYQGVWILLDVKNSNYYEIDQVVNEIVDTLRGDKTIDQLVSKYPPSEINRGLTDLETSGFLGEKAIATFDIAVPDDLPVENLVLNISHDCNLRCKYCFAGTGPYRGKREFMTETVAEAALDWFVGQAGDKKKLNLTFFGGEPLLNLPLIQTIIDYVHKYEDRSQKKIYMNICTNGTILNQDILYMVKNNDIGIQISLDGPKEFQDVFRPFPEGKGSYDTILPNVMELLGKLPPEQVIARATIPHGAIRIDQVVEHLFDLGFKVVFFVPAMGCGKYVVTQEDLPELQAQYDRLAETFIERRKRGDQYYVFPFAAEVQSIGDGVKRHYGCGAGLGFASVSVGGDIYPCMRFTDNKSYRLGTVFDGMEPAQRVKMIERTVEKRKSCAPCWARYFCGGACVAVPAEIGSGIEGNALMVCEVSKLVTKLAMYVNAKLTAEGIDPAGEDTVLLDFLRRRFE